MFVTVRLTYYFCFVDLRVQRALTRSNECRVHTVLTLLTDAQQSNLQPADRAGEKCSPSQFEEFKHLLKIYHCNRLGISNCDSQGRVKACLPPCSAGQYFNIFYIFDANILENHIYFTYSMPISWKTIRC